VQSELILLVKNPIALQSLGRRPGDLVPFEILLSNWTFMGQPAWHGKDAVLSWAATVVGGASLGNGSSNVNHVSIAAGENGLIAVFGVEIPSVTTAKKVLVTVSLQLSGTSVATNEWNLTVFPPTVADECAVQVFAAPSLLEAAQRSCTNALAVPPSLASQSHPYVLLRQGGLSEEDVVALGRTGGFGVSLSPQSGDWPVCGTSAAGSVGLAKVEFALPWWMSSGTTGTMVYATALAESLGFAADDYLDYSWMNTINGGAAYTLDGLAAAVSGTVHVRAIPADGAYGAGGFGTDIRNDALVWEGRLASIAPSNASARANTDGGRFLVSGLALFDGAKLSAEPVAEFAFDRLLRYAVTEIKTQSRRAATAASYPAEHGTHSVATDAGDAKKACTVGGSFCTTGSEGPCQKQQVTTPGVCNKGYEIITAVCLQQDAVLDAIYPRLLAKTKGSRMIGVVYETGGDKPVANQSFCAAPVSTGHDPQRLVASGNITTLEATEATWLRLPMPKTPLKAGIYWIGVLLEADVTCFDNTNAGNPAVGPGSRDAYATRNFSLGPGTDGREMSWTHGSGGFAIYATTRAGY
jgi:hypothetical protein